MTITAKWSPIYIPTVPSYSVSAPKTANGTVSVSPANTVKGSTVTVTVTATFTEDNAMLNFFVAFPAMQWACGAGVMQGTDGSLLPQDACTRAQIVTLLFRALAEK